MVDFDIGRLRNSNVAYLHSTRNEIDMEPSYQRQGAVWSTYKQQLLIDSLINGFDVPKIYLHQFSVPRVSAEGKKTRYALVDGKQRLEAIFDFLDGVFPLNDQFSLVSDPGLTLTGMTYGELAREHPSVVSLFNSTNLDVVTIRTDDIELIEEMFSRLNEAVPLNAAEKRNALGGPCPPAVRTVAGHPFFSAKLPFNNSRYRHYDLAAKFLYWEDQRREGAQPGASSNPLPVRDVKKYRLDNFFREMKASDEGEGRIAAAESLVDARLGDLTEAFVDADGILGSIGMVSLYYLLHQLRAHEGRVFPSRSQLVEFDRGRRLNRVPDEDNLRPGQYALLEFDRLAQSPNDGSALTYRLRVLDAYCVALDAGGDPVEAVAAAVREEQEQ